MMPDGEENSGTLGGVNDRSDRLPTFLYFGLAENLERDRNQ
jgi:hypothetical protein